MNRISRELNITLFVEHVMVTRRRREATEAIQRLVPFEINYIDFGIGGITLFRIFIFKSRKI